MLFDLILAYVRLLLGRIMSMEITTLSDVDKFNGANFSLLKVQMNDILIIKDQYFLIEGVVKKPSSMMDEEWNNMDKNTITTIHQYLENNVYFCRWRKDNRRVVEKAT